MICQTLLLVLLLLLVLFPSSQKALKILISNELNRDLENPHINLPDGGLIHAPRLIQSGEVDEIVINTQPAWEYGFSNYIWGLVSWDFYESNITFAVGWGISSSDEDSDSTAIILATYYGPSNTSQNLLNQLFNLSNCTPSTYMQISSQNESGYFVNTFYDGTKASLILTNQKDNDPTLEVLIEESDLQFDDGNYYLNWNGTDMFLRLDTDGAAILQDYYDPTFDLSFQWSFTQETTGFYSIRNLAGSSGTYLFGFVYYLLGFMTISGTPSFTPSTTQYQWDVKFIDDTHIALRNVYSSENWPSPNTNIPYFLSHYMCRPYTWPAPMVYQTCTVTGYPMLWQAGPSYDAYSVIEILPVDAF